MKRGISIWVAGMLFLAALLFRILTPNMTQAARTVFFGDGSAERIAAVFAADG